MGWRETAWWDHCPAPMALGTGSCPGWVEKGVAMGMLPPGQGFIHRAVPGMKGALWQCLTVLHSFWPFPAGSTGSLMSQRGLTP